MHITRTQRQIAIATAAFGIAVGSLAVASAQSSCPPNAEIAFFNAGGRGTGGAGRAPAGGGPPAQAETAPAEQAAVPPQGIYGACLDVASGHLTSLGLLAKVDRASWLQVDPKRSAIYTTGSFGPEIKSGGSISAFHIDTVPVSLRAIGVSPSGGTDPTHLAFDPHSSSLFIANHGEGVIGVIKTEPSGAITDLSDKAQEQGSGPSPRQKNAEAHGVAVDPTGHFVLSADFGADKIYVYRYDGAKGKLTPSTPAFITTPPGSGPRHLLFSPDGRYVIMNTEMNGQVRVYRWNGKAGTLEQGQVVDPFPPDYKESKSAAELGFSRDGHFLYLSLRGKEDKLLTYSWDPTSGQLAEIDRIPSAGGTPWSFGIDPSGKWMLVANSSSGTVSVFAVDRASGKLTPTHDPLALPGSLSVAFLNR